VQLYRLCEDLSEALIYLMVVFSPWAFGTTQPWAVWTMNIGGYALGLLLAAKLTIRWLKGYRPGRWVSSVQSLKSKVQSPESTVHSPRSTLHSSKSRGPVVLWSRGLVVLTFAILGYCLISAINARARYHAGQLSFDYQHCIQWLPHSLDSASTWAAFWSYLALACSFWAVRDWLLGKSLGEEIAGRGNGARAVPASSAGKRWRGVALDSELQSPLSPLRTGAACAPLFPARLRRLLWVLAINGALLGVEGVAQRLEGAGKLLFLVKPRVNQAGITQFGPYAYRANAAQYFNLLWPVCLGFWWTIQRGKGRSAKGEVREMMASARPPRSRPRTREHRKNEDEEENEEEEEAKGKGHHLLLLCSVIMAACPFVTTSRGGAMVTVGLLALAALLLPASHFLLTQRRDARRAGAWALGLIAVCFVAALGAGFGLGWKALKPRLGSVSQDLQAREGTYAAARQMAADYPLFGTGPGTFDSVFEFYRGPSGSYWPAQLHNDWLETRITFGWIGSTLIAMAFAIVVLRWIAGQGIHGGRRFVLLIWLAMAGCLVHARYDFPFQIYSVLFLFLTLCAVLFSLSRRA
jgi:hypothetical protein